MDTYSFYKYANELLQFDDIKSVTIEKIRFDFLYKNQIDFCDTPFQYTSYYDKNSTLKIKSIPIELYEDMKEDYRFMNDMIRHLFNFLFPIHQLKGIYFIYNNANFFFYKNESENENEKDGYVLINMDDYIELGKKFEKESKSLLHKKRRDQLNKGKKEMTIAITSFFLISFSIITIKSFFR